MIELSMRQVIWLRSGETSENEVWPSFLHGQLALETGSGTKCLFVGVD